MICSLTKQWIYGKLAGIGQEVENPSYEDEFLTDDIHDEFEWNIVEVFRKIINLE